MIDAWRDWRRFHFYGLVVGFSAWIHNTIHLETGWAILSVAVMVTCWNSYWELEAKIWKHSTTQSS